jgi:hypothetical protein
MCIVSVLVCLPRDQNVVSLVLHPTTGGVPAGDRLHHHRYDDGAGGGGGGGSGGLPAAAAAIAAMAAAPSLLRCLAFYTWQWLLVVCIRCPRLALDLVQVGVGG